MDFFNIEIQHFFSTRAAASILHPLGYTGDPNLGQGRVRGGALLLANYLVVMAGLGAGLALSLLHRVPNTYQGLEMASIGVQVSCHVNRFGYFLSVKTMSDKIAVPDGGKEIISSLAVGGSRD